MARKAPVSVIEAPEFLAATRKLMGEAERMLLVDYLAYNPSAGDLIPGTPVGFASCDGRWRDAGSVAVRG
jgi:hypothetical protein